MRKYKRGEILALSGEEGMVLCQCCQNMNQDSKNVKIKWLKPALNCPDNVFKPSFMGVLKDLSHIIDAAQVTNKGGLLHLDKMECKRLKDLHQDKAVEIQTNDVEVTKVERKRSNDTSKSKPEKVYTPETNRLENIAIVNSIVSDIINEAIKTKDEDEREVNNNNACYLPNCEVDVIDDFMFFSFNSLADLREFDESSCELPSDSAKSRS